MLDESLCDRVTCPSSVLEDSPGTFLAAQTVLREY